MTPHNEMKGLVTQRISRMRCVAASSAALAAFLVLALPAAAQISAAGTYEVRACLGPCDPMSAPNVVTGMLVLTDEPFSLAPLSAIASSHLRESEEWLFASLEGGEPNACFHLTRSPGAPRSFLASSPVGVTEWKVAGDGLSVLLWASPDAGYVAQLGVDGRNLVGNGYSWAPGDEYQPAGEVIVAIRTGPPELARCFHVIEMDAAAK
jgi:hypothetical protein